MLFTPFLDNDLTFQIRTASFFVKNNICHKYVGIQQKCSTRFNVLVLILKNV